MLKQAFGAALVQARAKMGKNRMEVARASGLDYRFLQKLEGGEKQPSLTTILLLAAAIGVSPDQLILPVWDAWNDAGQPDPGEPDQD